MEQWDKYGHQIDANIFKLPYRTMLGQCFSEWCVSAKIIQGERSFYKAKHTLGTELGDKGLNEREIGLFFGHSHASGNRNSTGRYISPNLNRCKQAQIDIDK